MAPIIRKTILLGGANMTTVDIGEYGGHSLNLYQAVTRLAMGSDTIYIIAVDAEDALAQIRKAYADLNVLYVESLERLAGSIYVSEKAETNFKAAAD
jgi:hypothetical protein